MLNVLAWQKCNMSRVIIKEQLSDSDSHTEVMERGSQSRWAQKSWDDSCTTVCHSRSYQGDLRETVHQLTSTWKEEILKVTDSRVAKVSPYFQEMKSIWSKRVSLSCCWLLRYNSIKGFCPYQENSLHSCTPPSQSRSDLVLTSVDLIKIPVQMWTCLGDLFKLLFKVVRVIFVEELFDKCSSVSPWYLTASWDSRNCRFWGFRCLKKPGVNGDQSLLSTFDWVTQNEG